MVAVTRLERFNSFYMNKIMCKLLNILQGGGGHIHNGGGVVFFNAGSHFEGASVHFSGDGSPGGAIDNEYPSQIT